ncbi:MAG: arsenate reductase ArsC [Desulfovibrio sp.]|nr:arsenate reductase ArsC [Desulfovibrio sp.]MBI4958718.1 arsenate reductase ArsC [Desulfovibrio sp.]
MKRVLFICVHNSARSQMAEAYLKSLGGKEFQVESAGFDPTAINPLVVEAMAEEGMDLSGKRTQRVFDLYKSGRVFDYVITVCEESDEAMCPIFPGMTHRLHIPFEDPAKMTGNHEEKMAKLRVIRDKIRTVVLEFIEWANAPGATKLGDLWEFKPARK